jgi:hypothetical protein
MNEAIFWRSMLLAGGIPVQSSELLIDSKQQIAIASGNAMFAFGLTRDTLTPPMLDGRKHFVEHVCPFI